MKIQVVSDLHLEFSDTEKKFDNPNAADLLVLSGDIIVAKKGDPHGFFARIADHYQDIVYVAGNHEYYGGTWDKTLDLVRAVVAPYSNIHFLENQTADIRGVKFVGTTLWTDMNKQDPVIRYYIQHGMNDYRQIFNVSADRRLSPLDTIQRHLESVSYIRDTVDADPTARYVVVGHHSPTMLSVHPQYKDDDITAAFASDLSEFILDRPQIKLWTCGHTHHAHWYYMGETLVVCNPRGYETNQGSENPTWNPNLVLDLDDLPDKSTVEQELFKENF